MKTYSSRNRQQLALALRDEVSDLQDAGINSFKSMSLRFVKVYR
ncbi:hypothetical protein [Vibrio diabolicus]